MSCAFQLKSRYLFSLTAALAVSALAVTGTSRRSVLAQGGAPTMASSESPAGARAESCGVPEELLNPQAAAGRGQAAGGRGQAAAGAGGGGRGTPVFPPGQYPIKLPAMSLLGAPNEGARLPNPYQSGVHWGQLPTGRKWGSTASVTTGPDGTLWAADRCNSTVGPGNCASPEFINVNPIFQLDPSGKVLKNIGAGLFSNPHKLSVDKDGFLWVADNGQHTVTKLDQNGKVLMTLGKKNEAGTDLEHFDAPTQVAVAPNGDIFVTDGHSGGGTATGNARVMKFDRNGKFIKTWGRKGMGPGEFDVLHDIYLDSQGRLFVADRQNNRIQIFDQDGNFIAMWYQFSRPSGIYIDRRTDTIYVSDSESRDGRTNIGYLTLPTTMYSYNLGAQRGIRIGSARDGKVTAFIPDPCPYPYPATGSLAEGVTADLQGNVYGADFLMTVRKFTRK